MLFRLSYAEAKEVAEVVRETLLSPRGRVTAVPSQNLLIVTEVADPERLRQLRAGVRELDCSQPDVAVFDRRAVPETRRVFLHQGRDRLR